MSEIVKYQTSGGEITLSPAIIRKYLVAGKGNVTDQECMMFLALCKYQKLNPFLREAYLIKFGTEVATMVTGKETFLKRAAKNEKYAGHKTGISENGMVAWAEIYLHGYDVPIRVEVDFKEYVGLKKDGKPNRMWATKPRTMLKKVALVQALREAFPQDLGGMYSQEEINTIDQPLPTGEITVEPESSEASTTEGPPPQAGTEPSGAAPTSKPVLQPEQAKLWESLVQLFGTDRDRITQELESRTSFTPKTGENAGKLIPGKTSIFKVSEAQAKTVRHQIENEIKKNLKTEPVEPEIDEFDLATKCGSCAMHQDCEKIGKTDAMRKICGQFQPIETTEQEAF